MKALIILGSLIAAFGIYIVVDGLFTFEDLDRIETPIAKASFAQLRSENRVSMEFAIPRSWAWRRMVDRFKPVSFAIVAITWPEPGRSWSDRRCLPLSPLRPELLRRQAPVPLKPFEGDTYLWLEEGGGVPSTKLEGLSFEARPGDVFRLNITSPDPPPSGDGYIVVVACADESLKMWFIGLKESIIFGAIVIVIGAGTLLGGLLGMLVRPRGTARENAA